MRSLSASRSPMIYAQSLAGGFLFGIGLILASSIMGLLHLGLCH